MEKCTSIYDSQQRYYQQSSSKTVSRLS